MVKIPNTNLLLGVGGIIAAVFLVNQLRKAGGDLQGAIAGIKFPAFPDITFPEFPKFPDINIFPSDDSSKIAGETVRFGDGEDGTTVTIPPDTTVNPDGTVSSDTPPLLNLTDEEKAKALAALEVGKAKSAAEQALANIPESEDISGAELASAINDAAFKAAQEAKEAGAVPEPLPLVVEPNILVNLLPDNEQEFQVGGLGTGSGGVIGTIFENPIDTLSEVLKFFPQLTASQAADFLAEHSGILPSQIDLIDPDVTNIVASVDGENVQVQNVTISDLEAEALKAEELSCQLFGLNCK